MYATASQNSRPNPSIPIFPTARFFTTVNSTTTDHPEFGHGTVPSHWQGFLRRNENKTELFAFLAKHIEAHNVPGKQLLSTHGEDVVSSSFVDKDGLAPCTHEEGDTRVLLHAAHAAKKGYRRVHN